MRELESLRSQRKAAEGETLLTQINPLSTESPQSPYIL
jgi:hypothetical protein